MSVCYDKVAVTGREKGYINALCASARALRI